MRIRTRIHRVGRVAALLALGALAGAPPARGQAAPKKILVLDFDQTQVQGSLHDIFGRDNVNVGHSIANLISVRLGGAPGVQVVQGAGALPFTTDPSAAAAAGRANGADAVIAGSLIVYGSASGTAGVSGPSLGGIRLRVGRRTTIVAVQLEARLIDVASGMLIGVIPANAQGSRSGLAIGVDVSDLINADGYIDMTNDKFRHTAIGEFTDSAVAQLVTGVEGMAGRIGQMAAAPPPAPPSPPVTSAPPAGAPPVAATPVMPSGPVTYPSGPFAYAPWQFHGTEHFRYTVTGVGDDNQPLNGFYTLDLAPAGGGAIRMSVVGQLGTDSWSNTVTINPQQAQGPGAMMAFAPMMQMGPIGALLFNPSMYFMFNGRQISIGDGWSSSSGGNSVSVRAEAQCAYAGQGGVNVVTRKNDQVVGQMCIAPNVALALHTLFTGDNGSHFEATLTEYHP